MHAESNGRDAAANPRSTALGPFQFIKSTFIAVMRKHFPGDVAHLKEPDILALRTDRGFARRAAEAFSKDNLGYLTDRGLTPTFGHLRLAFLLGPSAAARVMEAPPTKPVAHILDGSVIAANPFMRGMSAGDLVARATRDVGMRQPAHTQIASADAAASSPSSGSAQPAVEAKPEPSARPAEPVARVAEAKAEPAAKPEEAAAQVAEAKAEPAAEPEEAAQVAEVKPEPAAKPEEAGAEVAEAKPEPKAQAEPPAHVAEAEPRAPAHPAVAVRAKHGSGAVAVINVTCNERQASCRRWIDQQVARLVRTHLASRDGRGGA
jgi:outer membrane biosynthesis protein TonB